MPRTKTHTFGPGSLESLFLKTHTMKSEPGFGKQVSARLSGTYRVFCGMGSEHTVEVDERVTIWDTEHRDGLAEQVAKAHAESDDVAIAEVTWRLLDWTLSVWSDPCDEPF